MKIILFILLISISSITPVFSHGSNDDCSTECNDYYCPPEMKHNKTKKLSENN